LIDALARKAAMIFVQVLDVLDLDIHQNIEKVWRAVDDLEVGDVAAVSCR